MAKSQLRPEKTSTYHIKNFLARREAAKARLKDPKASHTAVCGIASPSLPLGAVYDNPTQITPSDGNKRFPYACPRCFQRIARRQTVKGHFLKCVKKNGNPDALFWSQCEGYDLGGTFGEPKRTFPKKPATGKKQGLNVRYEDEVSKEEQEAGHGREGNSLAPEIEELGAETNHVRTNMKRAIRRLLNSAGYEETDESIVDARSKKGRVPTAKSIPLQKRKRTTSVEGDDDIEAEIEVSPWARPLHVAKKLKTGEPWHQKYSDNELKRLFEKIEKEKAIAHADAAQPHVLAQASNITRTTTPSRKRRRGDDDENDESDADNVQVNHNHSHGNKSNGSDDSEEGNSSEESDEDEDGTTTRVFKTVSRRKWQRRLDPGEESEVDSVIQKKPTKWRTKRFSDYHTRDSEQDIEVAKKDMVNAVLGYTPVVYQKPVTELQFYAETEQMIMKGLTGPGGSSLGLDAATTRRYEAGEIFCLDQVRHKTHGNPQRPAASPIPFQEPTAQGGLTVIHEPSSATMRPSSRPVQPTPDSHIDKNAASNPNELHSYDLNDAIYNQVILKLGKADSLCTSLDEFW